MKNVLFYAFLIVPFLLFTSCGNDDDNNEPAPSIVGSWELNSVLEDGEETFDPNDCYDKSTFIVNSDNTFKILYFAENQNGICYEDEDDNEFGTYTIDNNQLTLNVESDIDGEDEQDFTFSVSQTELVLEFTDDYDNAEYVVTFERL